MTKNLLPIVALLLTIVTTVTSFHTGHRSTCTRKKICNGNLMCAEVCERGSVVVDDWATKALTYQHKLQKTDKFLYYEFPSTHNSAISEADGYGIEKYFISSLGNGLDLDEGDDVGEGVCQYLSLTDQLRMGVRHIEIDQWWGPLEKSIIVCHSPIPLYPVGKINRAAEDQGLDLEWEPKNMSCIGTKRVFADVLTEIKDWMMLEDNLEEIVVLYFDTKINMLPEHITSGNDDILRVFGDMVWKYSEGSPLQLTIDEMLSKNKRIVIESNKESWLKPSSGDAVVFYPVLWSHQFGSGSFQEYPNCTVEGDTKWYGTEMVRALDGSFIEAATRCGVQIASTDYINPDDMKFYVWSWDQQEPSLIDGCTAMLPSGRWATLPCDTELSYACIDESAFESGALWKIDLSAAGPWSKSSCPTGSSFAAPHNGYSNALLNTQGYAQMLWLNAPNH